jgi:hypothetical protein
MKCLSKSEYGNAMLLDHVAGRLTGSKAILVAQHLMVCDDCLDLVSGQAAMWEMLDVWEAEPVSTSFNRRLYARIQESPATVWQLLGSLLNGWVARPALPLAALTLLVVAGFFLERPQVSTTANPAVVETPAAVSPTDAEQLNKALDDLQLLHQLDLVKDEAADASKRM